MLIFQVILLGHSMGGGASMMYAGTLPQKVHKLIMIDLLKPIHIEAEDQPERTALSLDSLLEAENKLSSEPSRYTYEEMVDKLVKSYGRSLTRGAAETLLRRGARRHEDGSYTFAHSPLVRAISTLSMTLEQQEAFAASVTCDVLMIKATSGPSYATKDTWERFLKAYKRQSRSFQMEVLEGTHHLHLNEPEPVALVINSFLRGLSQQDASRSRSEDFLKSLL